MARVFAGVDWPRLIGPGWPRGLLGLARLLGAIGGGFAAIGAGWLAPGDWGGVGAGAIGRVGAIYPPIMPTRATRAGAVILITNSLPIL